MAKVPDEIVKAAQAAHATYGVPVSVQLAQWALESGWGKYVSGENNYGGITAKVSGAVFPFVPGKPLEPATLCWTSENWQGKRVRCQRWFKDFPTLTAYFEAHAKLLGTSPRYAAARAKLPDVSAFIDVMGPIYATAPDYAKQLKAVISGSKLTAFNVPMVAV